MRRHNVSAAEGTGSGAEASWRRLSRATLLAMAGSAETHTWGPRPAILNDLSSDEETEEMVTVGESRTSDTVGADQADVGGGKDQAEVESGGLQMRQVRCHLSVAGRFGVPGGVWPQQLFCGKKPPQRPTAWGGSVSW